MTLFTLEWQPSSAWLRLVQTEGLQHAVTKLPAIHNNKRKSWPRCLRPSRATLPGSGLRILCLPPTASLPRLPSCKPTSKLPLLQSQHPAGCSTTSRWFLTCFSLSHRLIRCDAPSGCRDIWQRCFDQLFQSVRLISVQIAHLQAVDSNNLHNMYTTWYTYWLPDITWLITWHCS